ncbi:hypothetical protein VPH35_059480 [Triticum aestivum]
MIDVFPASDTYCICDRTKGMAAQQAPPPPPAPKPSNPDPSDSGGETGTGSNANPFTSSEWEAMGSETRGLFDFGPSCNGGGGAPKEGARNVEAMDVEALRGATPLSGACSTIIEAVARPASPSLSRIVDVPPKVSVPPSSPCSKKQNKKSSVRKFSAKSGASPGSMR